ncbi:hypothetical protein BN1723_019854, partial [Verticillium longisporum]
FQRHNPHQAHQGRHLLHDRSQGRGRSEGVDLGARSCQGHPSPVCQRHFQHGCARVDRR